MVGGHHSRRDCVKARDLRKVGKRYIRRLRKGNVTRALSQKAKKRWLAAKVAVKRRASSIPREVGLCSCLDHLGTVCV